MAQLTTGNLGPFGLTSVSGGPGTYLFREIAKIVSPEIHTSLEYLETAWPQTQAVTGNDRRMRELSVLQVFFAKLGNVDFAIHKVNAAVIAAEGAILVGAGPSIPVVAAVIVELRALEWLGIFDTIPDDGGLKDSIAQLKSIYDTALSVPPVQGPASGAAAPDDAAATGAEQFRQYILDRARAQVEFEQLRCHLQDDLVHYMQGLWSQWPDYKILEEVKRQGIPEEVIEPRFAGFYGASGAVPVTDVEWLEAEGGIDWEKIRDDLLAKADKNPRQECITLPTPGMTVEPALGLCCACEDYIQQSRAIELQRKQAELDILKAKADQEKQEVERFKKRLQQDLLSDPTPLEGADIDVKAKLKDDE